ncbi:MAG: hypothetical protein QOC97_1830 [Chloroflexota bacterium]|nr:hypothetical protein [Chloroflexota bacterium]
MPASPLRPWLPIVAAMTLLLAACTSAGSSGPPAGAASTAHGSTPATSVATGPSAEPTASASSTAEPPSASLRVEGGDPVVGQLGSFTWEGAGSDSPWLPGSPITVGAGERMAVTLATDPRVTGWTARRAARGTVDGVGAVGLGQGAIPIAFDPPPSGTWSVQVTVQFASGRGSAVYYWQVTVH